MTPALQKYLLYTSRFMNLEQLEYYKEYMPSTHYKAIHRDFNKSVCDRDDYQMDLVVIIIPDIKWENNYELIMVLDEKYIIYCSRVRCNSPLDITLTYNHLECEDDEECDPFSNKEVVLEHIPKNQQNIIKAIEAL